MAPPQVVLDEILGPTTRVLRRVDIYEEDGTTPYLLDAPVVAGNVNSDHTRDERRNLDLTLYNLDGSLDHDPDAFWYDKIVKVFRGAKGTDDSEWTTQIGEFQIDTIKTLSPPSQAVNITGRDYVAKLINSKFRYSTKYLSTDDIEDVIYDIAFAAGVRTFDLPTTGSVLDKDIVFERDTTRWSAIKQVAVAFSYDVYFKPNGELTMVEYSDPSAGTPVYTFGQGVEGVVVSYDKTATSTRIKNVIVASGEGSDVIPVTYVAQNNDAGSPTSVGQIGERTEVIISSLILTTLQAQDVAEKRLAIGALEEYSVNFASLVLPWLEVGDIVSIPSVSTTSSYYSDDYLFSTMTIPIGLGPMTATAKRIALVA